jgi:hypothetical protein
MPAGCRGVLSAKTSIAGATAPDARAGRAVGQVEPAITPVSVEDGLAPRLRDVIPAQGQNGALEAL